VRLVQQFGLDESLTDGVRRVDEATLQSVVVDACGGADDATPDCVSEGQGASGMRVYDAEDLVDRRCEARRSSSVVVVELC